DVDGVRADVDGREPHGRHSSEPRPACHARGSADVRRSSSSRHQAVTRRSQRTGDRLPVPMADGYSGAAMAHHRVRPGTRVRLGRIDPADTGKHTDEAAARAKLGRDIARLTQLQDVLYAERRHAVLVVLQGMDTSGKDGTVKHVMSGVNPSGCEVVPFKVPTEEEAENDFLWRVIRA